MSLLIKKHLSISLHTPSKRATNADMCSSILRISRTISGRASLKWVIIISKYLKIVSRILVILLHTMSTPGPTEALPILHPLAAHHLIAAQVHRQQLSLTNFHLTVIDRWSEQLIRWDAMFSQCSSSHKSDNFVVHWSPRVDHHCIRKLS